MVRGHWQAGAQRLVASKVKAPATFGDAIRDSAGAQRLVASKVKALFKYARDSRVRFVLNA